MNDKMGIEFCGLVLFAAGVACGFATALFARALELRNEISAMRERAEKIDEKAFGKR